MRPKARGLVQHGGPPGCMAVDESDPASVILYVMDGHLLKLLFSVVTGTVVFNLLI